MEAVDILRRIDRHQHFLGINLGGQGQLHQDAVDLIAAVQIVDQVEQFHCGGGFGQSMLFAIEANFFTSLYLAANVDFRRGVVAHQDNRQAGANSSRGQILGFCRYLTADFVRDTDTVKDSGGHSFNSVEILSHCHGPESCE